MRKTIIIMAIWTSIMSFFGCSSKTEKNTNESQEGEIQMMDPNDILMTLPTIENSMPGTNDSQKDSLNLEILEDDWRQLEFVNYDFKELIEQEIDSINIIIEKESVEVGEKMLAFKNLHVRKLIPNPLKDGIDIDEFAKEFSQLKTGSLSFNQYGRVNEGIYFNISDFQLYGLKNGNKLTTIGFYGLSTWENLETFKSEIKGLMSKYNLVLVDWRSRIVTDVNGLDNYLKLSE